MKHVTHSIHTNRPKRRLTPVAAAISIALLGMGGSAPTLAADVEIKAPAGGSVVIRNADGTVLVLSADSAGNVRVPGLPGSAAATAGVVCFDASGQLAKCPPNYGATGPTGATGATGATGLQGVAGVSGPTGATGPIGATGVAGATGSTGPIGPTGDVGPAGSIGPTGPIGLMGPMGLIGMMGPPGPAGATGPAGAMGPMGLMGMMGPQGPAGAAGATGPAGPAGVAGSTGATGPQGPQGLQGNPGPIGNPGLMGPMGPQGLIGPQGAPGIGIQGFPGPAGAAGPTGAIGPTGPTGATGPAGASGTFVGQVAWSSPNPTGPYILATNATWQSSFGTSINFPVDAAVAFSVSGQFQVFTPTSSTSTCYVGILIDGVPVGGACDATNHICPFAQGTSNSTAMTSHALTQYGYVSAGAHVVSLGVTNAGSGGLCALYQSRIQYMAVPR